MATNKKMLLNLMIKNCNKFKSKNPSKMKIRTKSFIKNQSINVIYKLKNVKKIFITSKLKHNSSFNQNNKVKKIKKNKSQSIICLSCYSN